MTANELLKKISKGNIEHFYFLHGSERVYQKQVIQALNLKLITEDNRDFNLEEFDGRYSSVHQWIDAGRTISFMGGTKLVVVENMHDKFTLSEKDAVMEEIKESVQDPDVGEFTPDASKTQQEQDIGALVEYANTPIEGVCLVVTSDKVDRRRKLLKKLADGKGSVSCEAPKEYTLIPWVIDLAKEQGYSMSKGSAEILVGRVGARPGVLAKELEKVLLYAGKEKTVSQKDISEVVGEIKQQDVFGLTGALVEKNIDKALMVLQSQFKHGGDAIQILGAITWQFRMIWEVKSYQAQGVPSNQIAKKIGAHPFAVEKSLKYASKLSNLQLQKCYTELVKTDRILKSSAQRDGAMETLIINIHLCLINLN
ncbi:MAG: DNA polymerase III subunit delta [Nitrospinaceae bacterium]